MSDTCCCCLEKINDVDVSITKCCHRMHTGCLILWAKTKEDRTVKCPVCRTVLAECFTSEDNESVSSYESSNMITSSDQSNTDADSILNDDFKYFLYRHMMVDCYGFSEEVADQTILKFLHEDFHNEPMLESSQNDGLIPMDTNTTRPNDSS